MTEEQETRQTMDELEMGPPLMRFSSFALSFSSSLLLAVCCLFD